MSIPATTLCPCLFVGVAEPLKRLERQRQQGFRSFLISIGIPALQRLPSKPGLPAPRRRPLRWRQPLARSRKHGDLRELHGLSNFGCTRELFGQRCAGELKSSLFRVAGTAGQSFEFGGDVRQLRHSKTTRLRVKGSSLWFQGVATKCFGAFFAESP